jgi:quercetin dioxygenase-like cupin family protein
MSIIHKFSKESDQYQWSEVQSISYDSDGLRSVTKNILIGENEGAPNSIMRYFNLEPGGHSKLEKHPQEHEAIILRGKGVIQIGENKHTVQPFDAVFIEGNELHQFTNPFDEPFGFICVIPKKQ